MDCPVDLSEYAPTLPQHNNSSSISKQGLDDESLFNELVAQTRDLQRQPYDPFNWYRRAQTLDQLGYPELVVGDTWKAAHLCQIILARRSVMHGFRSGYRTGFWMQDDEGGWSTAEQLSFCEKLHQLEHRALRLQTRMLDVDRHSAGYYVPRQYPWLADHHRARDDSVLDQINADLLIASTGRSTNGPCCIVAREALNVANAHQAFGVFATRLINKDEIILQDRSDVWGADVSQEMLSSIEDGKTKARSLMSLFRGSRDEEGIGALREVVRSEGGRTANTLMRIRCLKKVLRDGASHPLDHPLLARLTASYHQQSVIQFDLLDDIVVQNKALARHGIDIFADLRFDTWVLFTIDARIINNCYSTPTSECLCSLFALFNHSCAPNVAWHTKRSNAVHMVAKRVIQPGEQLFITYDGYVADVAVEERSARLSRWIAGGCRCCRCERERCEEEARRGSAAADQTTRRRRRKTTAAVIESASSSDWDCFEKPVLPEDDR